VIWEWGLIYTLLDVMAVTAIRWTPSTSGITSMPAPSPAHLCICVCEKMCLVVKTVSSCPAFASIDEKHRPHQEEWWEQQDQRRFV
jgi:hypothetical protein